MPRNRFIEPAAPVLRPEPPVGPDWLHEVKHDGWRAQIHLRDGAVAIFGKKGGDLSRRFRSIAAAVERLPITSAIIDAELVACNADGAPNFYAMMRGAPHGCCAYCFDLLEFDGRPLVVAPLEERRYLLRKLLKRAGNDDLRLSEVFDDPQGFSRPANSTGSKASSRSVAVILIVRELRAAGSRSRRPPGGQQTRNDTSCLRIRLEVASEGTVVMAPHGPVDHLGHHDSPVSGIGGNQRQLPIYGQPRTADARSYAAAFAPRARRPKPASSAGIPARGKTPAPLKSVLETEYVVALSPPEATQSASGTWQQV